MNLNVELTISNDDKVLEIGPGGNPHPRADLFLEKEFASSEEAEAQRAYQEELNTGKDIVFYTGNEFPFGDQEFDYAICSHVLEHVNDVDRFFNEVKRVARRGYMEFPTIYYDFIYNIPEHESFILCRDNCFYWYKQTDLDLDHVDLVRKGYYQALFNGHCMGGHNWLFFQGIEWDQSYSTKRVYDLKEITYAIEEVKDLCPQKNKPVIKDYDVYFNRTPSSSLINFLRKLHYKLGSSLK